MENERNSSNTTIIVVVLALLLLVPCILGPVVLGGMFFFWRVVPKEPKFIDMPKDSVEKLPLEHVQSVIQSTLYEKFDPAALKEKNSPRFGGDAFARSGSGLTVTDTGENFKAVELQGTISDEEIEKVLEVTKDELFELAKTSGVKITGEPNPELKERPDWLFKMYFKDIDRDSIRGFHFSYAEGSIQGAVEVLAAATMEEKMPGWKLVVVVHEK